MGVPPLSQGDPSKKLSGTLLPRTQSQLESFSPLEVSTNVVHHRVKERCLKILTLGLVKTQVVITSTHGKLG